jgi:DNA-binding response OmpR family regulator
LGKRGCQIRNLIEKIHCLLYHEYEQMNQNISQNTAPEVDLKKIPTILIVEDDPVLCRMYTEKFKFEGFNVRTALNGEDGLEMALREKTDMLLLDLMLPRLSGAELLTKLRQDAKGKDIKVIALTNLAEAEEKNRIMGLGALEYLIKAMQTPEEVVNKVKAHLS